MGRPRIKGKKRPREWHRGASQDLLWQQATQNWPPPVTLPDPALSVPKPLRRSGSKDRGEAAR